MSELLMSPAVGQVWRSRNIDLYVAVLEVRGGRVRFAPVQVSIIGQVTRDVRCSQSRWDSPDGLRRAFTLTDHRLGGHGELHPREP